MVGTVTYKNVISIDIKTEKNYRKKRVDMAIKLQFEKINENTVYWFTI